MSPGVAAKGAVQSEREAACEPNRRAVVGLKLVGVCLLAVGLAGAAHGVFVVLTEDTDERFMRSFAYRLGYGEVVRGGVYALTGAALTLGTGVVRSPDPQG